MKQMNLWLPIVSLLVLVAGCGSDQEMDEVTPELLSISALGGWETSAGSTIAVSFSEEMDIESLVIALDGNRVDTTTDDGRNFQFIAQEPGIFELSITGRDMDGLWLDPPFVPITLKIVSNDDSVSPEIIDGLCNPKNRSNGVNPAIYKEIVIAFSEPMAEVLIADNSPDFPFVAELSPDRMELIVKFTKGYMMTNETEYMIRLYGRDLAGNELSESIYSFVTFAMENGYGKTPEIRYLFAIDQKHVADLDKENITQDLAKEFTNNGRKLPPDPRISVGQKGIFWMIYGEDLEDRAYYLIHSVDRIDVYELGYIIWL